MRKAVTDVVLNTILTLVLTVVTFSVGFYIYQMFINNSSTQQVMKTFSDFLDPITNVCQQGGSAEILDVQMPIDPNYVYGILQTKVSSFEPGYPISLKKCEGGYCLCIFRVGRKQWDLWDKDKAVPLWHFNPPGLDLFVIFLGKVVVEWVIILVTNLIFRYIGEYIAKKIGCDASCKTACSGPQAAAGCDAICIAGCNAAAYAIGYAISYAVREFLQTLILEVWESMIFFNYPNFIMTTASSDNLEFKDSSGFNCDFSAGLNTDNEISEDLTEAVTAGAVGFVEGLIEGFVTGLFKGRSGGGAAGSTASRVASSAASRGFKSLTKKLVKAIFKAIIKNLLELGVSAIKLKFDQFVAIQRILGSLPESLKPECNVLDLIAGRQYVDPYEFTWGGKYAVSAITAKDEDAYNLRAGSLDVFECVKISELGPYCDSNTKVLVDSDHNVFINYRLVDPFNDPMKALFCVYAQTEQEVEEDFLDDLLAYCTVPGFCDVAVPILKFLIGDIVLAGQTALEGLYTECLVPRIEFLEESEYFQYWVAYPDTYEVIGNDGQISLLRAYLVSGNQATCENDILESWKECICDNDYETYELPGLYWCTDLSSSHELSDMLDYPEALTNPLDNTSLTCKEVWNMKYLQCQTGIHINPIGVLR